jgi:hypothetical protein
MPNSNISAATFEIFSLIVVAFSFIILLMLEIPVAFAKTISLRSESDKSPLGMGKTTWSCCAHDNRDRDSHSSTQ